MSQYAKNKVRERINTARADAGKLTPGEHEAAELAIAQVRAVRLATQARTTAQQQVAQATPSKAGGS
jgi:hypothetical protein